MRDLGMDDDLAWAIQCMEITQTSPSPSINCWLYLIDSYLSKNKDSEAWQIAIVSKYNLLIIYLTLSIYQFIYLFI